ncbi:MAG: hypothetical protein OXI16_14020 [Chloroflexota bacterium]|nr:hypothetical protein [Chloroflexota bacterium]
MFELGHELGLAAQTAQQLASLGGSGAGFAAQGVADSVEPARELHPYRELNQEIIGRFITGVSRFIDWAIYGAILTCVAFAIWGFVKLNRAADSPQHRNGAIGQIVFSGLAAMGVTLVWVFIGFGIEFGDVVSGGAGVDVGQIGTGGSGAAIERQAGDLVGFYGNTAVICDADVAANTQDADGNGEWEWDGTAETCTEQ